MPAKGALDDRRVSKLSDHEALESARIPLNSVRGSSRGVSHILERLYMVDNKPLTEVQSFMEEQHNFKATPKQYRYQFFVKWGCRKYKPGHIREGMADLASPDFDVEKNNGQHIANTDRLSWWVIMMECIRRCDADRMNSQFGDSTIKRIRLESEAIANPMAMYFRWCSVFLFDITATAISISCAWAIRQYDRSLDIQGTTDKFEQLMVTGNTSPDMQQSIHQFAVVFDHPLLPILTIALLYAASVSAVYCLHRHDRYLNPLLWLGAVVAIATGLLQGTGLRASVVQTVPGAVALSLLISAAFHYSVGAAINQCESDNGLP